MAVYLRLVLIFLALVDCGAFYVGMFKSNDYLVAQDRLYKERVPYRTTMAKYGRVFKCRITYMRVVDRLGYGRPPGVQIIRGGLQKKFVVLRLLSYNKPISVNIYVGCANKEKITTTKKVEVIAPESKTTRENREESKAVSDTTVGAAMDQTDSNLEETTETQLTTVSGEGDTGDTGVTGDNTGTSPGEAED